MRPDVAAVEVGALAATAPYIEDELAKQLQLVVTKATTAANEDRLTEALALQLWSDYLAIERLRRALRTRQKRAEAYANEFKKMAEPGQPIGQYHRP